MSGKLWTEQEIETLKGLGKDKTSSEIGKILNRSHDSVKHKAKQLKISLRKKGEKCSWAKYSNSVVEQARFLHDEGYKPKQISKLLSVPYWNICDFVYYKRGL